jgi:hypothetical protein
MIVAEITRDHLAEKWDKENRNRVPEENTHVGKEFHYDAMQDWWGWEDEVPVDTDLPKEKTEFKLYDDDDELYYSGWLLNDDWCAVQQFVLKWAEADSGCTRITVYKGFHEGYVQEIG